MDTAQYLTPVPVKTAKVISEGIRRFAEKNGLRAESWVHDLPLWFVTSTERQGIVRRVQVGVYTFGTRNEVRLIPEVFRFVPANRALVAFEQSDSKTIESLSLEAVDDHGDFDSALTRTWAAASGLPAPPEPPKIERTSPEREGQGRAVVAFRVSDRFKA
jgi:hypothetical protein